MRQAPPAAWKRYDETSPRIPGARFTFLADTDRTMKRHFEGGLARAALIAVAVAAACQPPVSGTPAPDSSGGGPTPVAPAAEPNTFRPDPTTPLPLPSVVPVAPAAEPNTFQPDQTVPGTLP